MIAVWVAVGIGAVCFLVGLAVGAFMGDEIFWRLESLR